METWVFMTWVGTLFDFAPVLRDFALVLRDFALVLRQAFVQKMMQNYSNHHTATQSMQTFLTAPKCFATPCRSLSSTCPRSVGFWYEGVCKGNPTPPTSGHHAKDLPMGASQKLLCLSDVGEHLALSSHALGGRIVFHVMFLLFKSTVLKEECDTSGASHQSRSSFSPKALG